MLSVIRHLGAVRDVHTEQGVTELTVYLPNTALGQSLTCSAAARGEIFTGPGTGRVE
jgi:hypothetical protein